LGNDDDGIDDKEGIVLGSDVNVGTIEDDGITDIEGITLSSSSILGSIEGRSDIKGTSDGETLNEGG